MATPTEPRTTYFQAASSDLGCGVAHQEGRGDRGRLDGDPQHAEVVGEHGQRHRRQGTARSGSGRTRVAGGVRVDRRGRPRSRSARPPRRRSACRRTGRRRAAARRARSVIGPPRTADAPGPRRTASTDSRRSDAGEPWSAGRPDGGACRRRAARQASSGKQHEGGHQSRSSAQVVEVGVAELAADPARQDVQDQDDEQHVEGDAELDDERDASGGEERHAAMPLSSTRNPTTCEIA